MNARTLITAPLVRFPKWVGGLFLATLRRCMGNGITGTASQFAFNAFLATIPFLFVVVTAIRLAGPDAYATLFDKLEATVPGISGLAGAFNTATASGAAAGLVIVGAAMIGLYMSSNAIGALVDGLDRAQRLPHRRWIRAKGINMLLAAGTVMLAVASVLTLAGGERMIGGIARMLGAGQSTRDLVDSLTMPTGLFTIFLFLALLYRFGPNQMRLGFRAILPGAMLATVAWYGSTAAVSLYATLIHNLQGVYGTLGTIFVYMTFLYFSGLMFLVGGELNAELLHRRQVRAARARARAVGPVAPVLVGETDDTVATPVTGDTVTTPAADAPAPTGVPPGEDEAGRARGRDVKWALPRRSNRAEPMTREIERP